MKIQKIRDVKTPTRGTSKSAGLDFYVPNDYPETMIGPDESILIPSGIRVQIPDGYMLMAANKSGVCTKTGLIKGAEIIDEDYEGEVHIHLINTSLYSTMVTPGQKVVQMILVPVSYDGVEVVDQLESRNTERGAGGFGSTGTH